VGGIQVHRVIGPRQPLKAVEETQSLWPHAELSDALRIGLPVNGHPASDRVSRKPARGAEFGDVAIDAVVEDVLDSLAKTFVDQPPPGAQRLIVLLEAANLGRHLIDQLSAHAARAAGGNRAT